MLEKAMENPLVVGALLAYSAHGLWFIADFIYTRIREDFKIIPLIKDEKTAELTDYLSTYRITGPFSGQEYRKYVSKLLGIVREQEFSDVISKIYDLDSLVEL
jgi:hypothetical protein